MSNSAEKDFLIGQLTQVEHLLSLSPNSRTMAPGLKQRAERLRQEIAALSTSSTPTLPSTNIFFAGSPAFGTTGLEAKFAAKMIDAYQDMVANQYAAESHGKIGDRGKRTGEADSRLYLTALPKGSFGIQLAQPQVSDFLIAQQVSKVLDEMTELVEAAADGDESFEKMLTTIHPRVLSPLDRFFSTLKSNNATCLLESGSRRCELNSEKIDAARDRVTVASKELEIKRMTMKGMFKGATLVKWRFDFIPETGEPISGYLADDVTEDEATRMNSQTSMRSLAEIEVTRVQTKSGKILETYELKSLKRDDSLTEALPEKRLDPDL